MYICVCKRKVQSMNEYEIRNGMMDGWMEEGQRMSTRRKKEEGRKERKQKKSGKKNRNKSL